MKTALLGLAFLLAGTARGDEPAYTILLRDTNEGDTLKYVRTNTETGTFTFAAGGNKRAEPTKVNSTYKFTDEVLVKPAGVPRATKLLRTYETAEKTVKKELTKLAFHGEAVLVEKKGDGDYHFSIGGKEIAKDDAEELHNRFNDKSRDFGSKDFLPTKPVKVGETWTPDMKPMIASVESAGKAKVDAAKTTFKVKLAKVYQKDGARFGVLEVDATVTVTEMALGEGPLVPMAEGSVITTKSTADACIDGTTLFENATSTRTTKLTAKLPNGTLTIEAEAKGTDNRELVKKAK